MMHKALKNNNFILHMSWVLVLSALVLHQAPVWAQDIDKNSTANSSVQNEPSGAETEFEDDDQTDEQDNDDDQSSAITSIASGPDAPRIRSIYVQGNTYIPTEAIVNRIPFQKGERFSQPKTRKLISNLYYELKRIKNVQVYADPAPDNHIDLYVVIEEKTPLSYIGVQGNKKVSEKEIKEKVPFDKIPAIDDRELPALASRIKKLYVERGFLNAQVEPIITTDEQGTAQVTFEVKELARSVIKRIEFCGNSALSGKKLRNALYSKEDWILSFLDRAGIYQPERVEADRYMIEQLYQNNGYADAQVTDTHVDTDECGNYFITFDIEEGIRYNFGTICIEAQNNNGEVLEDRVCKLLAAQPGKIYSREAIIDSIKTIEFIWGDLGYIFAQVTPQPVYHPETCTADITFLVEPGEKIMLRTLTIKGNTKTRDKIVRRQIVIDEGNLLTNSGMEISKTRIESLGFFEVRDGVNWNINRVDQSSADLDLFLKEAKTGSAHIQLGFGGSATDFTSPVGGMSAELNITDTNLLGLGIKTSLVAKLSKSDKDIVLNVTQPWLFDRPILGAADFYQKRLAYEDLNFTEPVNERHTGGSATIGFVSSFNSRFISDAQFRFNLGAEGIHYERIPRATIRGIDPLLIPIAQGFYNQILDEVFDQGVYGWVDFSVGQEKRNHPMHPSNGHAWFFRTHNAYPIHSCIGFSKFDFDAHWFTSLINDYDLVFHLHGYLGLVTGIGNKRIPYRELFHLGGPASVRGYLFGEIGPQFEIADRRDSIGGTKAFFVNAELLFPITPDLSIKGLAFYDGGAGWDNPVAFRLAPQYLIRNNFDYRHSVGVGLRILQPMPVRIDWGFKLDPRDGEKGYEVHFGTSYDW
ncbi:hypothetical protein J120_02475 [candidate division TM6 bacterium JCVI TM6SC1]|jgi:outer membrane protein insertion porin family|uniref:Outer membrane protein assembly factor BamA n=1 Tax=candidate division TM6 bacterium JCVI TM6SC1 TaxID=1306947 RepID=A0A0D2JLG4_9BACT|nr:hypothetical protein J120_02475 [candidate division TM6 bacterium JCVI TM6SC1]